MRRQSYRLNGVDRFQLYFDSVARKNTGVGNVIRAVVTLNGRISETGFRRVISSNEAIRFLSGLSLKKNRYSTLFHYEQGIIPPDPDKLLSFYSGEKPDNAMDQALARDCSFSSRSQFHIDVVYDQNRTYVVFSVSHVLMDYAGMENLLMSVFEKEVLVNASLNNKPVKSFLKKFIDAVEATFFVAARTAWNMKRLSVKSGTCRPAFEKFELTAEETKKVRQMTYGEIRTNALSFYLASSLYALNEHHNLLTGKKGIFFIAVPVNRRPHNYKSVLLSNFHSYIYFHAKADDMKSVRDISQSFSRQMILQARRQMPEKFSSLLDLFRFIPSSIYHAFIDLPTNGHAGTFAFSLLANSRLEDKYFENCPVIDVTHYAPVITPPGLNIVFSEYNGSLKIILSFDEGRMTKNQARDLLDTIRKNLIG